MQTWKFRTEVGTSEIDAKTVDQAARLFAAEYRVGGVRGLKTLAGKYEIAGDWLIVFDKDGAWVYISDSSYFF